MRVLRRHFAADVLRQTAGCAAIVAAVVGAQAAFRAVERAGEGLGAVELVLAGARDVRVMLARCWPLVCILGACSAVLHWSRRGQDRIAAAAGVPMRAVVGPGLGAALLLLGAGALALGPTERPQIPRRVTWSDGSGWGAAHRQPRSGWIWMVAAQDPAGARLGVAADRSELPGGDWVHQASGEDPLRAWWEGVLLLVLAGLVLRAVALGGAPPPSSAACLGIAVVLWFGWRTTRRVLHSWNDASFGLQLGLELAALALAAFAGGALLALRARACRPPG